MFTRRSSFLTPSKKYAVLWKGPLNFISKGSSDKTLYFLSLSVQNILSLVLFSSLTLVMFLSKFGMSFVSGSCFNVSCKSSCSCSYLSDTLPYYFLFDLIHQALSSLHHNLSEAVFLSPIAASLQNK